MSELAKRHCVPCESGATPLGEDEVRRLLGKLEGWAVPDGSHLEKTFRFRDFAGALAFVNRIGEVAERENHHPDLHLGWGRVRVELRTHKIKGLSENDFIVAAKIDELPR